jgi:ATP:ADP antiporter, AAA family
VLGTVVAFNVARRASNYAVLNPAMEVLFTVVPREDKYKAKSFIETFVYRAGDQLGAWGYAGLAALGLGLPGISWVAVPVSGLFLVLGVWLGRRQVGMAREANDAVRVTAGEIGSRVPGLTTAGNGRAAPSS